MARFTSVCTLLLFSATVAPSSSLAQANSCGGYEDVRREFLEKRDSERRSCLRVDENAVRASWPNVVERYGVDYAVYITAASDLGYTLEEALFRYEWGRRTCPRFLTLAFEIEPWAEYRAAQACGDQPPNCLAQSNLMRRIDSLFRRFLDGAMQRYCRTIDLCFQPDYYGGSDVCLNINNAASVFAQDLGALAEFRRLEQDNTNQSRVHPETYIYNNRSWISSTPDANDLPQVWGSTRASETWDALGTEKQNVLASLRQSGEPQCGVYPTHTSTQNISGQLQERMANIWHELRYNGTHSCSSTLVTMSTAPVRTGIGRRIQ